MAEDRHSNDYTTPEIDASQDVELLFVQQSEEDGTSWGVVMKLNSCDDNDYAVGNHSRWMHWALGTTHDFIYHGDQRGQFHSNLLVPPKESPSTDGLQRVDITMPDVPVVLGDGGEDPANPYICTFFDLTKLLPESLTDDEKVHAVRMSPLLNQDSEEFVHHVLLYVCDIEDKSPFEHLGVIPECQSMPEGCEAVKYAWAVGGQDVVLPVDVGIPFAPNSFLALQVHYYNPNLVSGIVDSSGLSIHFTPELRPIDAGFMEFNGGTDPSQRDPLEPGRTSIAINPLVIPSDCTSAWTEPISIVGAFHHMHLVGSEMKLGVERGGEYLGNIRTEHQYDFNHQSFEEAEVRVLNPGDKLSMQCTYDTSTRTNETVFGDLSQQEMCYGLLLYYPNQPGNDAFGYFKLDEEEVAGCTSPGTGLLSQGSLCAQVYLSSISSFFKFAALDGDYGAVEYCNGEAGSAEFQQYANEICPTCHQSKTCTADDVHAFGQDVICPFRCDELGLPVYPDTATKSSSAPSNGIYCGSTFEGYVPASDFAPEPKCQVVGDLSKAVEYAAGSATSGSYGNCQIVKAGFWVAVACFVASAAIL